MYNISTDAPHPIPAAAQQPGLSSPVRRPGSALANATGRGGIGQLATLMLSFSSHLERLGKTIDATTVLTDDQAGGTGADRSARLAGHGSMHSGGGTNADAKVTAIIAAVDSVNLQTQFLAAYAGAVAARIWAGHWHD